MLRKGPSAALILIVLSGCDSTSPDRSTVVFEQLPDSVLEAYRDDPDRSEDRRLPETMGPGIAVADFDADGYQDIFVVRMGKLDQMTSRSGTLLFNQAGRSFRAASDSHSPSYLGYGQGTVAGDLSGDGLPDLVVTSLGHVTYFENTGRGNFETGRVIHQVKDSWPTSVSLLDFDSDGDADIYIARYVEFDPQDAQKCYSEITATTLYCHPDVYPAQSDLLLRNDGGVFVDVSVATGISQHTARGKGLGVVTGDFDRDGLTDLYVANDSTANFMLINRAGMAFDESGLFSGVSHNRDGKTEAGMGVIAADLTGDCHDDLFVTNLSLETNSLYVQDGPSTFSHVTASHGLAPDSMPVLGFGVVAIDVNDDNWLDLVVANGDVNDLVSRFNDALSWEQPAQVFLNQQGLRFSLLDPARYPSLALPRVSRGLAAIDFNKDGRMDLALADNRGGFALFMNGSETSAPWIGIDLAPDTGRTAAGARVILDWEGDRICRNVQIGTGYLSSSDSRQVFHFPRGWSGEWSIEVEWPGRPSTRHRSNTYGCYINLLENSSDLIECSQ